MYRKKFYPIIVGLIVLLIIIVLQVLSNSDIKGIIKRPKFTTTIITTDYHHKNFNGVGVDYEYFINSKKYTSTIDLHLRKNEKYLLIYDSLKYKNNLLLEIYQIQGAIKVPLKGWRYEEVPITIDSLAIKKYIDSF
jgi:hypothetical protein